MLGVALAACGGQERAAPRVVCAEPDTGGEPPAADPTPPAVPETAVVAPVIEACWIELPDDASPHTGIFRNDPIVEGEPFMDELFVYDGSSLVARLSAATMGNVLCDYRELRDLGLQTGIYRVPARDDGEVLEAFLPCDGWVPIGRFTPRGLRLNLPFREARDFYAVPFSRLAPPLRDEWLRCRELLTVPAS